MDLSSARPLPRRELIPYLILLIALAVTASAARYAHVTGARQQALELEASGDRIGAEILSRTEEYLAMLLGGAGLFAASADVTREEFHAYVGRLEVVRRYPNIRGIGFSLLIRPGDRDAVLAAARRTVSSFHYWPDAPGEINAIIYLEPPDEANVLALGFDMASEGARRAAMERARDSGVPAATARVTLVQERAIPEREQAGFLIYVPVYRGGSVPASVQERRDRLLGFVYSPFRADDFLQGILTGDLRAVVGLEVFDGPPSEGRVLHRSNPDDDDGRFFVERPLEVAGRTWTILVRGGNGRASSGSGATVALIAAGGMALSVVLFLVTRTLVVKRVEAELQAEDLRASEGKLRTLDREKDEFLATVSHELRTPLNAIVGWASMLGREGVPAETQTHAIRVIKRNAAVQTRLIEDLLDMSRAVAGHLSLTITDVDARATLDAAVDALRPSAEAAGLMLDESVPTRLGMIEADAGRLLQIVTNLLSNSIKFTPRGGHVGVKAERYAGTLTISVTDTGIGIAPEFVPFLFARFKQADSSTTRPHSGAGLGLAIARHLVELHGGTVEATSGGLGTGAMFTVRLPTSQRRKGR